ncbi:MAG: 50S ribosomal protein L5 [Candidatus Berkelbacteria bacterium]|nr:50S ribosomal protein L5 [Candidatus Berkelbacteria bacterium]
MSRLKEFYQKQAIPKMKEKFGFKNNLRVPRVEKIVISVGIGSYSADQKMVEEVINNLVLITGQIPIKTKAKKAISGFKLRKNQQVGLKITLRGERMYYFLDKLINIALPRTRDFKGTDASFDGHGNLNLGLKEQIVFPEIDEATERIHGFLVTITTNAEKDEEAKELLTILGMKFKE